MTDLEKRALEIQALQDLQTHPYTFLRKNSVTPGDAAGAIAGMADYRIEIEDGNRKRPGYFLGNLNKHDNFRFKIKPASVPGGTWFQASYIPVQQSDQPINPYPLPTTGSGLMITTQLTGCCVVMIPGGGTWSVAHLQPAAGVEDGLQLRQRLSDLGMHVYGASDYSGTRATLIGVRRNGNWDFYTQKLDGSFNVLSTKKLSF